MRRQPLSETLRAAVRRSGESLRDLEAATGIDRGRLSRFLARSRTLTLPAVDRLCSHLGLTLAKKGRRRRV